MHNIKNEAKQRKRREEIKAMRAVAQFEKNIEALSTKALSKRFGVEQRYVQPAYVNRVLSIGESHKTDKLSYQDAKFVFELIQSRKELEAELKEFKKSVGL